MPKKEWGTKRKCVKCGALFYDLRKDPFSCPKCGETYTPEAYQEATMKKLLKMARKAVVAEEAELDEEALIKLQEDIPVEEVDLSLDADGLDLLEDPDDTENDPLGGKYHHGFEDEENDR